MMSDEQKPIPVPQKLTDIPEHVRVWLATITPEKISRYQKYDGFIMWAETSGRYGRAFVLAALAVFGTVVSITQGWSWLGKFFTGK